MNMKPYGFARKDSRANAKHASRTFECYLCGKVCRGNGGIASHERACYARNGLEWFSARDHAYVASYAPEAVREYRVREDAVRYRLQPHRRPDADPA